MTVCLSGGKLHLATVVGIQNVSWRYRSIAAGEVTERLIVPVSKTGVPKGTVGSNPTLSVA